MSLSTFNTVRRGGSSEEPGDRERYRELWRSTTKEVALEYIQVPHYYMGSSQVDGPMFA